MIACRGGPACPPAFGDSEDGGHAGPPLHGVVVRKRSLTGTIIVLSMFALGGLVLAGLYLAPRGRSKPAPAGVGWGVPQWLVRVVSYNILHNQRGRQRVIDELRKLEPD